MNGMGKFGAISGRIAFLCLLAVPVAVPVGGVGCYSWTDTLTGTFPGTTTVAAGSANEVILVQPHQPLLATTDVVTAGTGGTQSVVDGISVTASRLAPKPAWTMAEVSAGRREMLLRAITGIVMLSSYEYMAVQRIRAGEYSAQPTRVSSRPLGNANPRDAR